MEVDSLEGEVIKIGDLDIEKVKEQQYSQSNCCSSERYVACSKRFQYEELKENCYKYFKSEALFCCNRNCIIGIQVSNFAQKETVTLKITSKQCMYNKNCMESRIQVLNLFFFLFSFIFLLILILFHFLFVFFFKMELEE